MSSKINTVEDYRRRLIELSRNWPRNLSTQKIMTEELLSIIQEQIVEYAKYYNYDELLSDKVEYAVTSYLEQKNRSVCETTTTASY